MNERRSSILTQPFEPNHPAYITGSGPIGGLINLLTRIELWRRRPTDTTAIDASIVAITDRLQTVRRNEHEMSQIYRLQIAAQANSALQPNLWTAQNSFHLRRATELGAKVVAHEAGDGNRLVGWYFKKQRDSHEKHARNAAGKLLRRM